MYAKIFKMHVFGDIVYRKGQYGNPINTDHISHTLLQWNVAVISKSPITDDDLTLATRLRLTFPGASNICRINIPLERVSYGIGVDELEKA